jgi:DNA/RNA endonuclease G (NUC1)
MKAVRRIATLLVFCFALILGTAYADQHQCSNAKISLYPVQATPGYDHDKFGTSRDCLVQEFRAFISCFDTDDDDDSDGVKDYRAVPEWVAYEIKRYEADDSGQYKKPEDTSKRPQKWYKDPDLAFLLQQQGVTSDRLDDSYRGIGTVYNRGHLAMKLHAERIGWKAGCNTHHLANAVPQWAGFNQGIWLDLEYHTGAWANKYGAVWVIAGPIYVPGMPVQYIGDSGEVPVAIPHALFKIVTKESSQSTIPEVLAFIYPQQHPIYYKSGNCNADDTYEHERFLTSVEAIENLTGLTFFRNVPMTDEQRDQVKRSVADDLWPVEDEYFGISCD